MKSPIAGLRRGGAVAAALALTLAVTACGDDDSAAGGSAGGRTTIQFLGADPAATFEPLIKAFTAANPTITVQYVNVPFDQFNSVVQQRLTAKDPSIDVLYVDPSAIAGQVKRGWLEDLSALLPEAQKENLSEAVKVSTYQDKLYAAPMWTSAQFLYYNKDLLEKAGVQPPSADPAQRWTWEQVIEAGKKARDAGAQYGLLFDQTDRYYQLQALPESAGGGPGVTGPAMLTPDVTNAGWQKAMTWYRDLFAQGHAPRGVKTDQMNVLFGSGKSAFFVGGPWSIGALKTAKSTVDYGIAPHPYFAGGKPGMPTDSWSLGVSTSSDAKDAARKFVQFAGMTKEGNLAAVKVVTIPPTNRGAFDEYIKILDGLNPPNTTGAGKLMLADLENAVVHRPATPGYTQMEDIMGKAFADIRNGQEPGPVLQRAQGELERAWSRLG
jgi:multiple sugar transport system substrate-binding protein